uniref:Flowering locus D n=1 Tax=Arundo donax TaxID=35708 RepID=A0A0A9CFY5_ARUDO
MSYGSSWSQNARLSLDSSPALAYSRFARCQLNKSISPCVETPPSAWRNVSSAAPSETSAATSPMDARRLLDLSRSLLNVISTFLSTSGSTGDPSGR